MRLKPLPEKSIDGSIAGIGRLGVLPLLNRLVWEHGDKSLIIQLRGRLHFHDTRHTRILREQGQGLTEM